MSKSFGVIQYGDDVIRLLTLTDSDLTITKTMIGTNPGAIIVGKDYIKWDEISHFSYLKETIKFSSAGTGLQAISFDFKRFDSGVPEGEGYISEPEIEDSTTVGVIATGWARFKNGWNNPVSIGNANLVRVDLGGGLYKYVIECNVNEADLVAGVTADTLEIELNYNTEED